MTATTPAPTVSAPVHERTPDPLAPRAPHPAFRMAGPVALIIGSWLAAVGMGLHIPSFSEEIEAVRAVAAAPNRWVAAHLLTGFGFTLVAIGAVGALPRHRGRGALLTTIGALLTAAGAIVMALSDMAHGAVGFALTQEVDVATSLAVQTAYFEDPVLLGLNTGPLLLPLGMMLLGAGLLRSRLAARWVGIVVILTPFAVHAAFNIGASTWLNGSPIAVGMTVLATALLRRPRA